MVQHSDGNVSLKSALGLWIGVYPAGDGRSSVKAVGAVLADGVISADAYFEDAQKFALIVSYDGSFSLKYSLGGCLAASGIGEVRLGDCNSADASFTMVFQDDERVVAEASSRKERATDVVASEVGPQLEVEFHTGVAVPLRRMTSFSNLYRASIVVEGVDNVSQNVSRKMAMKSNSGFFLAVQRGWLQDFEVLMMAIDDKEAGQIPECTRFEIIKSLEGKIALRTMRSSYVVSGFDGHYTTSSEMEMFTKLDNDDGTISLQTSQGMFWSALPKGPLYSSASASLWERLRIVTHPDGTVSIRNSDNFPICAVERTVNLLTCETRSTANRSYFMQGSSPSIRVSNLGFGAPWYGYKTKVDLYYKYVKQRAELDYAGELIILTDNGDMAWGGCSYQELLAKYDEISRASDMAPVVAGADNALYPFGMWDYSKFDSRRERVMKAFNMSVSAYCAFSNCHEYEYKYANSGFLMGPPRELSWLLACMIDNGKVEAGTHRGALLDSDSGFDDQQGLHECMSAHPELVTLDYSGTLSLELIKFDKPALVFHDGKVFNKAADSPQCFVHGNGDTLGTMWDSLFPGSTPTENFSEDFYH